MLFNQVVFMSNPAMFVHELSPQSVIVDFHNGLSPMANPERGVGFVLTESMQALGATVMLRSAAPDFGQLHIRGTVEDMLANQAELLARADAIANHAASLEVRSDFAQNQERFAAIMKNYVQIDLAGLEAGARLKSVIPGLLNPLASDGSEPFGYLRPVMVHVNDSTINKPQIMRVLKQDKAS